MRRVPDQPDIDAFAREAQPPSGRRPAGAGRSRAGRASRVLGLLFVVGLLLSGRAAAPSATRAQEVGTPQSGGFMQPGGMACLTRDVCYIAGTHNEATKSTGVILPLQNGVLAAQQGVAGAGSLDAVDCAGNDTCYAVGRSDADPEVGVFVTVADGVAPRALPVAGTAGLRDIACPDADTCYAVGDGPTLYSGVVVTIAGGAVQSVQTVAGASLRQIACVSGATCTALGDSGALRGGAVIVPIVGGVPGAPQSLGPNISVSTCGTDTICGTRLACVSADICYVAGSGQTNEPPPQHSGGAIIALKGGVAGERYWIDGATDLTAITCEAIDSCYAAGTAVSDTATVCDFQPALAIACQRPTDVVSSPVGLIVHISPGGSSYGYGSSPVRGVNGFTTITCPAQDVCYALGRSLGKDPAGVDNTQAAIVPLTPYVPAGPIPCPTPPPGPRLVVGTSHVQVGQQLEVSGTDFAAHTTATLWLDDDRADPLGSSAVGADGSFQAQLTIPSAAVPGAHRLSALVTVTNALGNPVCYEQGSVAITVVS